MEISDRCRRKSAGLPHAVGADRTRVSIALQAVILGRTPGRLLRHDRFDYRTDHRSRGPWLPEPGDKFAVERVLDDVDRQAVDVGDTLMTPPQLFRSRKVIPSDYEAMAQPWYRRAVAEDGPGSRICRIAIDRRSSPRRRSQNATSGPIA